MTRSPLAVPTAAACLALLFTGCTTSADAESSAATGPSSQPPAPSPSTPSADEAAALAVVNDVYAAYNSGDAARFALLRSRGGYYESEEDRDEDIATFTQQLEADIARGVQFTNIQCVSHGYGQWPGVADEGMPTAEGYYFTCEADNPRTHETHWVVADGEIVAATSP